MRHLDYYDGLRTDEPDFETWLIVIIEGLYYCESKNAKWIKRSKLENRSNAMLDHFSKGEHSAFGGTYGRLIKRFSNPLAPKELRFFRCDKRSRKYTRIYLKIKQIKYEIERRKNRNLENNGLSLIRVRHELDQLIKSRPLLESMSSSDSVSMVVTKAQPKNTNQKVSQGDRNR